MPDPTWTDGPGWQWAATALAVLTPLVGVPLTAIMFYLKALREQQASRHADVASRLGVLDASAERLRDDVCALHRDGATKEEWLRETMWARGRIEQLTATMTRAIAELEQLATAPATAERAARAVALLEERVAAGAGQRTAADGGRCVAARDDRGEERS